jgi:hypothetical protein
VRTTDRITGVLLLALAVGFVGMGRQYPYWADTGPGSGFVPFWVGLAMGVLAVLLLVGAMRRDAPGASWLPAGRGLVRLVAVFGLTVLLTAILEQIGMVLAIVLFLVAVLKLVEGYSWVRSLAIAVGAAAGCYLLFVRVLRVPFPEGPFGF